MGKIICKLRLFNRVKCLEKRVEKQGEDLFLAHMNNHENDDQIRRLKERVGDLEMRLYPKDTIIEDPDAKKPERSGPEHLAEQPDAIRQAVIESGLTVEQIWNEYLNGEERKPSDAEPKPEPSYAEQYDEYVTGR